MVRQLQKRAAYHRAIFINDMAITKLEIRFQVLGKTHPEGSVIIRYRACNCISYTDLTSPVSAEIPITYSPPTQN
jgi:hypothetical protein